MAKTRWGMLLIGIGGSIILLAIALRLLFAVNLMSLIPILTLCPSPLIFIGVILLLSAKRKSPASLVGETVHTIVAAPKTEAQIAVKPSAKKIPIQAMKAKFSFEGHIDLVNAVAVTPDGKSVVSGSEDNTIKVWDLESGKMLRTFEEQKFGIDTVAATPDGKKIICGSLDEVKIWDLESGQLLHSLKGHTLSISAVAVTPDGSKVISGSMDSTLKIWDLESGQLLRSLKENFIFHIYAVAVTPDGSKVISGSNDCTLKIWDLERGKLLRTLKGHTESVDAVAVTPDGSKVISGSYDSTLKIWDLERGKLLRTLEGHTGSVNAVAVTPDGSKVISGSDDCTLKIWDLESGQLLHSLEGHNSVVKSVAVTPDGRKIISGSWDNNLKIWDLESGQLLRTLDGFTDSNKQLDVEQHSKKIPSQALQKVKRDTPEGERETCWFCMKNFEDPTKTIEIPFYKAVQVLSIDLSKIKTTYHYLLCTTICIPRCSECAKAHETGTLPEIVKKTHPDVLSLLAMGYQMKKPRTVAYAQPIKVNVTINGVQPDVVLLDHNFGYVGDEKNLRQTKPLNGYKMELFDLGAFVYTNNGMLFWVTFSTKIRAVDHQIKFLVSVIRDIYGQDMANWCTNHINNIDSYGVFQEEVKDIVGNYLVRMIPRDSDSGNSVAIGIWQIKQ